MASNPGLSALLLLLATSLPAELIHFSELDKKPPRPQVRRNIFSLVSALPVTPPVAVPEPELPPPPERNIAEEIRQSVIFEGYLIKNGESSAMLTASGEFFIARVGETVLEKIKILAITPTRCTVEYEGAPYEISLKGGSDATRP